MHFHLPKPLHGWREFVGEIAIIVIGVLVALGAEQLVTNWHWDRKADEARVALKEEASSHYFYTMEWRIVAPCIAAQLDRLEARLDSSEGILQPAPLLSDVGAAGLKERYVIRTPDRPYSLSVWQGTVSDGTSAHFATEDRQGFDFYTRQVADVHDVNIAIRRETSNLLAMKKAIALDPMVRLELQRSIDRVRQDNDEMALVSGQIIGSIVTLHLTPDRADVDAFLKRSGTITLCRAQHLPLTPERDAATPPA